MVVKIATWILNQEEEFIVDGFILEAARVWIARNDFNLMERKAVLLCSKLEGGKGVMLPQVTLC